MNPLYDTLVNLAPAADAELQDGYRRYVSMLEAILTPDELAEYAKYIHQTREVRILEELSPAELAALPPALRTIATTIVNDLDVSMENRRVVALLSQRGEHAVAPDLSLAR